MADRLPSRETGERAIIERGEQSVRLVKIERQGKELAMTWDDGRVSTFTLEQLRDNCPCASCAGETVLLQRYVPPPPDRTAPGRYTLVGIAQVGSYAIQPRWADGHETGIYTLDHLNTLGHLNREKR